MAPRAFSSSMKRSDSMFRFHDDAPLLLGARSCKRWLRIGSEVSPLFQKVE